MFGTPRAYGPIALTAGQYVTVGGQTPTVCIDAIAVYFVNKSNLDLGIWFGQSGLPPAAGVVAGVTVWHAIIPANDRMIVPVNTMLAASAAEQRLNTIGRFDGTINIYPMANNASGQGLNGTYSNLANVYYTAYGPNDPPPQPASASDYINIASQLRIIGIPIAPQTTFSGSSSTLAVGGTQLLGAQIGLSSSLGPGQFYVGYLHYAALTPTGATAWAQWALSLVSLTAGLVVITRTELARFVLVGNLGSPPVFGAIQFMPATPAWAAATRNISDNQYGLELMLVSSAGSANAGVDVVVGWTIDQQSHTPTPGIGGIVSGALGASQPIF